MFKETFNGISELDPLYEVLPHPAAFKCVMFNSSVCHKQAGRIDLKNLTLLKFLEVSIILN